MCAVLSIQPLTALNGLSRIIFCLDLAISVTKSRVSILQLRKEIAGKYTTRKLDHLETSRAQTMDSSAGNILIVAGRMLGSSRGAMKRIENMRTCRHFWNGSETAENSRFLHRTSRDENHAQRSCLVARLTERYPQCISRLLSAACCAHNFYFVVVQSQSTPNKMCHYLVGDRYIQITRNGTQSTQDGTSARFRSRCSRARIRDLRDLAMRARRNAAAFPATRPRPPKSYLRL